MAHLSGQVAIVTGAGSGIGRACAVALGSAGAAVVVNDLVSGGLDDTVADVEAAGGDATALAGDVRSAADVHTLVELAESTYGGLDVMVANAAVSIYTQFEEQDEETIDVVLDTNLRGALLCAQAAIAPMRRRGGGSIVFLSSVQGYVTLPGCVPYAATKAGVVAAAKALAVEVGPDGIRVNAVAPGTIDTPMLHRDLSGMNLEEADRFLERVRSANALRRIGTPQEIADVVVFLASPAAGYVTGTSIVADGGYLAVKTF